MCDSVGKGSVLERQWLVSIHLRMLLDDGHLGTKTNP